MNGSVPDESLIELIGWLEHAGQNAEIKKLFSTVHRASCKKSGYDFNGVESTGTLRINFWFPLDELHKVAKFEEAELEEWLNTINIDQVETAIVDDNKFGRSVKVTRLHHIPSDRRDNWIAPDLLPEPDYKALYYLLNLKNQAQAAPDGTQSPKGT